MILNIPTRETRPSAYSIWLSTSVQCSHLRQQPPSQTNSWQKLDWSTMQAFQPWHTNFWTAPLPRKIWTNSPELQPQCNQEWILQPSAVIIWNTFPQPIISVSE